jgi:hypothetical protein
MHISIPPPPLTPAFYCTVLPEQVAQEFPDSLDDMEDMDALSVQAVSMAPTTGLELLREQGSTDGKKEGR